MGTSGRGAPPDWYATSFDTTTTGLMWAECTEAEVDRVLAILAPPAGARILDLACGSGRHAIELAQRGFDLVGVDISAELIEIAQGEAALRGIAVEFARADLRDLDYGGRFDAVLSLHDGAIGYLEDDEQNRRLFEVVAAALRPGGAHLIQVPNVLYAESHFPQRTWRASEQVVELLEREWNPETRSMEGQMTPIVIEDFHFGLSPVPFRKRLYSVAELRDVYGSLGMSVVAVLDGDGDPHEPTDAEEELFAVARKG